MNKQKNKALQFSKQVITELNDTEVSKVNGGTFTITNPMSCSFCISSSNGDTGNLSIIRPFNTIEIN